MQARLGVGCEQQPMHCLHSLHALLAYINVDMHAHLNVCRAVDGQQPDGGQVLRARPRGREPGRVRLDGDVQR